MYTRTLVPLDGSQMAESALPYLKWFVKVSDVNEVVFLHVVTPLHMAGGLEGEIVPKERKNIEQDAVKLATDYLDRLAAQFGDRRLKVRPVVLVGKPAKVMADYIARNDVDLIIMAIHGFSGIHRWVRGSVADEILHAARVPVFLVKPQDRPPKK